MYLIIGLGNPTSKYEQTRHNAGFIMLDRFAKENSFKFKSSPKFKAEVAEGSYNGEKIILAKPQTFMNLSGESVRPLADFYKIPPENIIVVYDDVYIEFGNIRTRMNGSAGGHNGMKSIIAHLGTENFPRIRIGVGFIPENIELYDYVLNKFTKAELECLTKKDEIYDKFLEGLEICLKK